MDCGNHCNNIGSLRRGIDDSKRIARPDSVTRIVGTIGKRECRWLPLVKGMTWALSFFTAWAIGFSCGQYVQQQANTKTHSQRPALQRPARPPAEIRGVESATAIMTALKND